MNTLITNRQKSTYRTLNHRTRNERNTYFGKVVEYNTNRLQSIADAEPNRMYRPHQIEDAKMRLSELNLLTLEWLKEADEFFNTKLEIMVAKLEKFGFLEDNVGMDFNSMNVSTDGGLDFWIIGFDRQTGENIGRVYARLVPVEGYEVCFHYRFVCTLKKVK